MSDSCLATPSSYKGEKSLRLSPLIIEIPILGHLRGKGGEGVRGIWLLPVQNLTSNSYSATPISYKDAKISRLSCSVMEIPILCHLGGFGGKLEVFGYFQCKI